MPERPEQVSVGAMTALVNPHAPDGAMAHNKERPYTSFTVTAVRKAVQTNVPALSEDSIT
jgi:hypothetical protein